MNACGHEANRLTLDQAEDVLADPMAPHCLEQAAMMVLARAGRGEKSVPTNSTCGDQGKQELTRGERGRNRPN